MKAYIKEILEKRKQLSTKDYKEFSNKICQSIIMLEEYRTAKNILIFLDFFKSGNENAFFYGSIYFAPALVITAKTVRKRILRSSQNERFST